jgi:cytochrome c biogenesis protein CcmG/thiol:disulfide interchange protein DsbE
VRRGPGWLAAPLVLALAACTPAPETSSEPAAGTASPFADCAGLSAPPSSAAPDPSVPPSSSAADPSAPPSSAVSSSAVAGGTKRAGLPALTLPCFTGGQEVALGALPGPAVINMWASWCGPCRDELPVMQGLADRTAGRLHVLGVDVGDSREAAASFGAGRSVTMPTLYDRDRRLLAALGRANLPVTVFVDAGGRTFVHPLPVDRPELIELVRAHTGVTVAR